MNQFDSNRKHVVLIDDERSMRESIEQWLTLDEFEVDTFDNGQDAIKSLNNNFHGVVVTDLKMQNFTGMDVINRTMELDKDIPVILITGHGDIDSAVKAMRLGAYDFIEKPFEPERLLTAINRATEKRHLVVQNRMLQHRVNTGSSMHQRLIGDSKPMCQLRDDIANFAQIDINILLCGETGTGKEVIANCLHDFGKRSGKPFHAIDCGTLPTDGLEEDLFGTAEDEGRTGQLALANGGTLFLDEILNMPVSKQAKLLRVLQSGEIRHVGESANFAIDVRVISAANETLQKALEEQQFRRELYFRLNTIELIIPPLRDRGDDVIQLFKHFANKAALTYERTPPNIANNDITVLKSHHWPGNVRELENVAERFVLFQTASVADILNENTHTAPSENLLEQVQSFERSMIEFALSQCKGNISDVCKQLGIPRRTLNDKILKLNIDRASFSTNES